jgi:hypothetical protein
MSSEEIEERTGELAREKFELLRRIEVVDHELDTLIERKSAQEVAGRNKLAIKSGRSMRRASS